jgi:hypothetical protein
LKQKSAGGELEEERRKPACLGKWAECGDGLPGLQAGLLEEEQDKTDSL